MSLYSRLRTPPVFWPLLLFVRATALAHAGRPGDGMVLLDEALAVVEHGSRDSMASGMCRPKGDLLLALDPDAADAAEPWYRRALEIATGRRAATLELRAALSLGRFLRGQGREGEARSVLAETVARAEQGEEPAETRGA